MERIEYDRRCAVIRFGNFFIGLKEKRKAIRKLEGFLNFDFNLIKVLVWVANKKAETQQK